jgi:Tfp pilus assembly protein PilN
MQAVNLLPPELRPGPAWQTLGRRAQARRVLTIAGIAAGVLALLLAGAVLHQRGVVEDRQAELAEVQARLVAADAKASSIREAQAANEARLAAVRDLVARRIVWEDVLRDLSRVLPPNVWLQSLQVGTAAVEGAPPVQGAAPAGSAFTVTGQADSQVRVAQVLDRLALLPWLSGVTLVSSTSAGESRTPVTFNVTATFTSAGGGR